MSAWRKLEAGIIGNILFPLSNSVFNRRGILNSYRQFIRNDFTDPESLKQIQFARLRTVIGYANQHVPYYRRLFKNIGLEPLDIQSPEDIRSIPPLSRQDLVDHRLDLIDERWRQAAEKAEKDDRPPGEPLPFARFRSKGHQLIRNRSSGSTGAPTVFYENGSITASNWANELRLRQWFGIKPGEREARMARVSAEYLRNSKVVVMRRWLWNQLALPGVSLTEEDHAFSAGELRKFEPKVLWGFTSALTGFAEYIKNHPEAAPKNGPNLLITWAAPLYDHERAILEEVFRCSVTNIYGTRELGHIAGRCELGNLHLNQESIYLEAEDSSKDSGPSELLATTLMPTPMPFIRYRTGDLGKISSDRCECGRTLEMIGEFTGRTGETFTTSDGRLIAPNFWCRTFMDTSLGEAINRFQVVYRPNDVIVIRLVKGPDFGPHIEKRLNSSIITNLFSSAKLVFEYPDEIAPQLSGKYQMVVNECD